MGDGTTTSDSDIGINVLRLVEDEGWKPWDTSKTILDSESKLTRAVI